MLGVIKVLEVGKDFIPPAFPFISVIMKILDASSSTQEVTLDLEVKVSNFLFPFLSPLRLNFSCLHEGRRMKREIEVKCPFGGFEF